MKVKKDKSQPKNIANVKAKVKTKVKVKVKAKTKVKAKVKAKAKVKTKVRPKYKYPRYKPKQKPVSTDTFFQNEEHYQEAFKEWRRKRELNNSCVKRSREKKLQKEKKVITSLDHYKTLYEEIREQLDDLIQNYPECNLEEMELIF